ncbi:hypothetical protein F5H01DRAFT_346246 [Linnemannia elongata]|nr:hypothetical protein F5H01DRAFT_346246 [Linnemannia elongata]
MYLSDLAHGVLLVLGRISREGLGSGGSLGSLGSATATDHEEGTDGEDDNDGSRDTTSNGTNVGLVLGGGTAGDVVGHGDGGGGGVGTAVRVGVVAEDLFLAETHAHVNLALLAERLVLGALLEHAEVAVAVLPLLASEGAGDVLGRDLSGHVAVQMVDVVDTGNKGSNSVLGIQAGLALQVSSGHTVRAVMALKSGRADSVLVTEELGPWGDIGDVRGGHCDDVFVE